MQSKLRQSVAAWCFKNLSLEQLCPMARAAGMTGIDLVGPEAFATLAQFEMTPTMLPSHGITQGLNRQANHAECIGKIRLAIEAAALAGAPSVACFSGNRGGLDDETGLKNCAIAIKQFVALAEQRKVTVCIEVLNSKRNHADYMCDTVDWAARLVRSIGSDRFKMLFDIYHVQIQQGNLIESIQQNHDCIGHYHTAGVPGRREIGDDQEINYPAIMRAIAATGYTGWIAHEFIPAGDPAAALAEAAEMCSI